MVIMRLQISENEASRESTCANRVIQYEDPDINKLLPADGAVGYRNRLVVSAQVCKSGNLAKHSQSPVIPSILLSPEDEITDPKTRTDQVISLITLLSVLPLQPPPPPAAKCKSGQYQIKTHFTPADVLMVATPAPSADAQNPLSPVFGDYCFVQGQPAPLRFLFVRERPVEPPPLSQVMRSSRLVALVRHWMMKPHPSRVYFWFE